MKQALLIAATAILAASAVSAEAKKPEAKPAATPKTIHCAVMAKDEVDIAKATKDKMFADYKGNRYFFCCEGCPAAFKKDPAKYAKAEHIPTPKAK
jgi:YHS domain-containing protein